MPFKAIALGFGIASGLCGMISAVSFLMGSKSMPWEMQTWNGQSDKEKKFRANAHSWNLLGLIALLCAFALSAASSLATYYS